MLLPWYNRPIRQWSQFTMNGNLVVKTSHYCLFSQEFFHSSRKWKLTQGEILVLRYCDTDRHFIGDALALQLDRALKWAPIALSFPSHRSLSLQRPSLLNISSRLFAGHVSNSVILTGVWSPALLPLTSYTCIYIKMWVLKRLVMQRLALYTMPSRRRCRKWHAMTFSSSFLVLPPLCLPLFSACRISMFLLRRESNGSPYPGDSNSHDSSSVAPLGRGVCLHRLRCLLKLCLTLLPQLPNHFPELHWWSDTSQRQRYFTQFLWFLQERFHYHNQ